MNVYKLMAVFYLSLLLVFPLKTSATSWANHFVVWNGNMYVVSDEHVQKVENEIGAVTKYSDMKQYGGNFSNIYPKGTKYFTIKDIDTDIAIAVETADGEYVKAVNDGEYTYSKSMFSVLSYVLWIIGICIIIAILIARKGSWS